jgi:hypothetical protein
MTVAVAAAGQIGVAAGVRPRLGESICLAAHTFVDAAVARRLARSLLKKKPLKKKKDQLALAQRGD